MVTTTTTATRIKFFPTSPATTNDGHCEDVTHRHEETSPICRIRSGMHSESNTGTTATPTPTTDDDDYNDDDHRDTTKNFPDMSNIKDNDEYFANDTDSTLYHSSDTTTNTASNNDYVNRHHHDNHDFEALDGDDDCDDDCDDDGDSADDDSVAFSADVDRASDSRNTRHSLHRIRDDGRRRGDDDDDDDDDDSAVGTDVPSEASMNVLMRYMGCSSAPYMAAKDDDGDDDGDDAEEAQYVHDLREGDHVIRWKMLGFCYPIQVHGIVFSAGPDFVTIVDCGWGSESGPDKAGGVFEDGGDGEKRRKSRRRRRMHILTIADEKEINKWTKIRYGEEVQLKVHSSNQEMKQKANGKTFAERSTATATADNATKESPSAGLELEEVEQCVQAKIKPKPRKKTNDSPLKKLPTSWFAWSPRNSDGENEKDRSEPESPKRTSDLTNAYVEPEPCAEREEKSKRESQTLRLPKADPPALVLARLRFLLEYGEDPFPPPASAATCDDDDGREKQSTPTTTATNLLPPHHLLYANSECIAVFCKTGRWSTLQATIFLHSTTVGNVKQSVTLAVYLSAQTVTIPASGLWGFFGGTTTISLFAAQPWLVPALVGGGVVYVGLPMIMLTKAKGRWGETERRLNDAFWSMCDSDVVVEMIRCWSGLEG